MESTVFGQTEIIHPYRVIRCVHLAVAVKIAEVTAGRDVDDVRSYPIPGKGLAKRPGCCGAEEVPVSGKPAVVITEYRRRVSGRESSIHNQRPVNAYATYHRLGVRSVLAIDNVQRTTVGLQNRGLLIASAEIDRINGTDPGSNVNGIAVRAEVDVVNQCS